MKLIFAAYNLLRQENLVNVIKNSLDCVKKFALMVGLQGLSGSKVSSDTLLFVLMMI